MTTRAEFFTRIRAEMARTRGLFSASTAERRPERQKASTGWGRVATRRAISRASSADWPAGGTGR